MLHIHHANRFERLEEMLLARLQLGDAFERDQIVVPGAAIRRRLALRLADAHGVCAQVEFAFLARWLWRQIARVVPGVAEESPFDAEVLTWRIYAALGDPGFVSAQPRLAHYLDAADAVMRHELAARCARLFEQYITYRPDWLAAWSAGRRVMGHDDIPAAQDEAWQAALWRLIGAQTGATLLHPGEVFVAALRRSGPALAAAAGLPARAHVFALPAIAPQHLEWLAALGVAGEVHVYLLNPCREHWFDLVGPRGRTARRQGPGHDEGHPLLASWGRQTQDAIDLLVEATGEGVVDTGTFEPAGRSTLLAKLQDGILDLTPPAPGELADLAGDGSLEVHIAHSLTRQLEALHQQLLRLFAADDTLSPGDVLVATPDIEAAAPLIETVFGTVPAPRRIPYAITGRGPGRTHAPARALLALLGLAASRMHASELLALLQLDVVARRFGLDGDALQAAHEALRAAGLRWGLDAAHRASFDLPADERHTLADALQRLFLAYSLPGQGAMPFAGRLPAASADAAVDFDLLGRLAAFARQVEALHAELRAPRQATDWARVLGLATDRLMQVDDTQLEDLRDLRDAIRGLADAVQRGGCEQPLPVAVIRRALEDLLGEAGGAGVPTGSVTFASMSALRTLPYRVVCVIGLDDGAFPGAHRPAEFDLMVQRPRRGDRQRRVDERNLFLDLLLAARERLLLTYTGRSVRDNAPLPPSVVVAELLDFVVAAVVPANADAQARAAARARLTIQHPLQPFSPTAFTAGADPRVRSYDEELCIALRQGATTAGVPPTVAVAPADRPGGDDDTDDDPGEDMPAARTADAPFFAAPLPRPPSSWQQVTLADLADFFRLPCRFLLRRRLGLDLPRPEEELEDDEPFVADRAVRAALGRRLVPALLDGADDACVAALARAGTELPAGALGEQALQAELASARRFAERIAVETATPALPAFEAVVAIDLDGQPWRIAAPFADVRTSGLLRWRYGALRASDRIEAWLNHLLLCAALPQWPALRTRWHGVDAVLTLRAPEAPLDRLADLLRLYRRGLSEPLRFFPRAAMAYVDGGRSLVRAQAAFIPQGGDAAPWAEGRDPAVRLALRGLAEPLDGDFEALALAVFEPLLAHAASDEALP